MGHTSIVFCISIDLHIRITFFVHIVFQAKKKRKEKAKKQNAFPCKFQKTLKGSPFYCHYIQVYLWRSITS